MRSRGWIWWLNALAAVFGVVALIVTIHVTGPQLLLDAVRSAGWALALTIGFGAVAIVFRALAVRVLLRTRVPFGRILVAQGAATAVQDLTPTGALSDVVKATVLMTRAPGREVASTIVAYDVITLQLSLSILVVGVVIGAVLGVVPPPLDVALWVSAGFLLVLVGLLVWLVRRGLSTSLVAATARLRVISPARRDRWASRLAALDERLRELHGRGHAERRLAFLAMLGARVLVWAELYVVIRVLGLDPSAGTFIGLVLALIPVTRASTLMPLGLGLADLGAAGVFALLGFAPEIGVAAFMLVRIRQLACAAAALTAMLVVQALDRGRVPPGGVEPPLQPSEGRAASVRGGEPE